MLDFEFSKEHEMVRRTVREFAQAELAPRVTMFDEEARMPNEVIALLAKQNLLALTVSSKYGGLEADPVLVGVIAEELARADISCAVPTFYLVQAAWGHILDLYGTDVAKEAILPSAVKGAPSSASARPSPTWARTSSTCARSPATMATGTS